MAVTFECTTRTSMGMAELFDLSRSIDTRNLHLTAGARAS